MKRTMDGKALKEFMRVVEVTHKSHFRKLSPDELVIDIQEKNGDILLSTEVNNTSIFLEARSSLALPHNARVSFLCNFKSLKEVADLSGNETPVIFNKEGSVMSTVKGADKPWAKYLYPLEKDEAYLSPILPPHGEPVTEEEFQTLARTCDFTSKDNTRVVFKWLFIQKNSSSHFKWGDNETHVVGSDGRCLRLFNPKSNKENAWGNMRSERYILTQENHSALLELAKLKGEKKIAFLKDEHVTLHANGITVLQQGGELEDAKYPHYQQVFPNPTDVKLSIHFNEAEANAILGKLKEVRTKKGETSTLRFSVIENLFTFSIDSEKEMWFSVPCHTTGRIPKNAGREVELDFFRRSLQDSNTIHLCENFESDSLTWAVLFKGEDTIDIVMPRQATFLHPEETIKLTVGRQKPRPAKQNVSTAKKLTPFTPAKPEQKDEALDDAFTEFMDSITGDTEEKKPEKASEEMPERMKEAFAVLESLVA